MQGQYIYLSIMYGHMYIYDADIVWCSYSDNEFWCVSIGNFVLTLSPKTSTNVRKPRAVTTTFDPATTEKCLELKKLKALDQNDPSSRAAL